MDFIFDLELEEEEVIVCVIWPILWQDYIGRKWIVKSHKPREGNEFLERNVEWKWEGKWNFGGIFLSDMLIERPHRPRENEILEVYF